MARTLSIIGENKTGKTTLALTAPKKIGWIEFDIGGFDRAKPRFPEIEKQVETRQFYRRQVLSTKLLALPAGVSDEEVSKIEGMEEMLDDVLKFWSKWLDDPEIQTIVVDPWTRMWKIVCDAQLQIKQTVNPLKKNLGQLEYGQPNSVMEKLIHNTRMAGKNLILIQNMDDEYVSNEPRRDPAGNIYRIPAGWKWNNMKGLTDLVVRTHVKNKQPYLTIEISGEGMNSIGSELKEPTWDTLSQYIAMMNAVAIKDEV